MADEEQRPWVQAPLEAPERGNHLRLVALEWSTAPTHKQCVTREGDGTRDGHIQVLRICEFGRAAKDVRQGSIGVVGAVDGLHGETAAEEVASVFHNVREAKDAVGSAAEAAIAAAVVAQDFLVAARVIPMLVRGENVLHLDAHDGGRAAVVLDFDLPDQLSHAPRVARVHKERGQHDDLELHHPIEHQLGQIEVLLVHALSQPEGPAMAQQRLHGLLSTERPPRRVVHAQVAVVVGQQRQREDGDVLGGRPDACSHMRRLDANHPRMHPLAHHPSHEEDVQTTDSRHVQVPHDDRHAHGHRDAQRNGQERRQERR
mmetsp:Transcript_19017/g.71940  ORF Transcript_19017/g.71940 Transcript_19017/m.71940 type:complete len:316 (+) Transcript_19017:676-1623(+)